MGFIGYYCRFIQEFAGLSEPLVALTRKGIAFAWTDRQQVAFDTLKSCLLNAPILGFPTEDGRFILDMDASLYAVGGVLNQLQEDREVVIVYASRSLRLSQRRYCTTRQEMLVAVIMCTHFRAYLRGALFTLHMDHSSLRWLQKFRNTDGMLPRWYMLLGQFSVTFEYRPGAQHANADGLSRQCGQCSRPDCPVSAPDARAVDVDSPTAWLDQPFEYSEMGDSMDADLLPELSGETWVVATLSAELTADLSPTDEEPDLIAASRCDETLTTVRQWVQTGTPPPPVAGMFGLITRVTLLAIAVRICPATSSQLVVPGWERRDISLFSRDIWVSPGPFIGYWTGFIGQG